MNKKINKVAVIGSGIMGSRIACHFANIGVKVLLLDVTSDNKEFKNQIVDDSLKKTIKSKPAPLYKKEFSDRIEIGNLDDDLKKIESCDWILEAIIENLEIKKQLFKNIEKYRKKGSIISSNTSGIPIESMLKDRSSDFCEYFCGTHFFNPPRYLKLLEIIPSSKTNKNLITFLMSYGEKFLGKTTVLCNDTPAFIANRVGVAGICSLFKIIGELNLTIDEVDRLTGQIIGRPKSATFRTSDLVGLDTLARVAEGVYNNCQNDEHRDIFKLPNFITKMIDKNMLGSKTLKGFYKKDVDSNGKKVILSLDIESLEYRKAPKPEFELLKKTRNISSLSERLPMLIVSNDLASQFYKKMFAFMFSYVSHRINEICDEIYKIDKAMCAGFGWKIGPFEMWDQIGIDKGIQLIKDENLKIPSWIEKINIKSFYKSVDGNESIYSKETKNFKPIPVLNKLINLKSLKDNSLVWKNEGVSLIDIGDDILNIEFHTKLNSIGKEVIEGINHGLNIAEKDYKGLVIGNQGEHFSAGADISMIFTLIVEQEWKILEDAVKTFQNTSMRIRYSDIPVVVATHGLVLGGGCELSLHADAVQAAAESYIGLVELGVGLIPGGGGTKEMALRASQMYYDGDIELPRLKEFFINIGQAKVATSAHEAFDLGYLQNGKDNISINSDKLIQDAKEKVNFIHNLGYTKPIMNKNIKVLGKDGLGMFLIGADTFEHGGYITKHEQLMCEKLAYVLCGGNLSSPTNVTEQYLLDIEREAFLSLCGEPKTLERIKHMLEKGKPLRN